MKICSRISLILSYLFISSTHAQSVHVDLNELTTLDDIVVHITLLESRPKVKLLLPNIDTTNAKFFDLFYTWDVKTDPTIDAMLISRKSYDELYIDINNDENLTNDGSPSIFRHDENSFSFDIISPADKNQKAKLILQRKPELPDSIMSIFLDKNGNLSASLAKQYGIMRGDFRGKLLLLNFWGEWCKPCSEEIPQLCEAKNQLPENEFAILSFAKSTRVDVLNKVISDNEMDWPHVILADEISEKFKISGYPTNILILKDGRICLRTGRVSYSYIAAHLN
ncbi:TlpA family protein disulfide reductase [candidate division KSB1 bacterium]|nr:TlpA family protein disulfide reductase [candidate division KSB1 bacterium]